ncbi:MAG: sulfatase-like hydrolase/transferase [Planctomycetales bacterium]|nr:sulfatase-like hydrolase/transferase [Planctomycetales bacterium]
MRGKLVQSILLVLSVTPQLWPQQRQAAAVPDDAIVDKDVVYETLGDRQLKLDLYRPYQSTEPLPLVIWVHGGAWQAGSKNGPNPALSLLQRGYAVASVEYRLSGEAIFPAAIEDCKAAVCFLRLHADRYGLDPHRFGAWGASAGGHLVSLLGTTIDVAEFDTHPISQKTTATIHAVCNWFGPSDFLRMNGFASVIDHDAANSPESRFIGGAIQENKQKSRRANPITYITAGDPPMLHVHGDADRLVPFNQSELLHDALQKRRVPSTLHKVVGGDHGFGKGEETRQQLIDRSMDFFDRVLKPRTQHPKHDNSAIRKAPQNAKNVLLLISDDLRASALGCYGDKFCRSPNIDELAARGLVFDRAYCQGTACGPSRRSFMFSRYRGKAPTNLAQHFRENGWFSARVGKVYHMRVPGDIIAGSNGDDEDSSWTERYNSAGQEAHTPGEYACLNLDDFRTDLQNRQSTAMPHRPYVSVQYDGSGEDQPDFKTATKTIELLNAHANEPFFIAAGFVRPHYPMVAPRQYFEGYDWQDLQLPPQVKDDLLDIPKLGRSRSRSELNGLSQFPNNQKRMWAAYYASISFMDQQVGRVLKELDRLGLRDSTAIVFTSDHGYHLGDHTFWQKADLHEEVVRVPLILSLPGESANRTNSIVELVDLFPTLAEWVGLDVPSNVHGTSLLPLVKDPNATVKDGAISFANGESWRTAHWSYMRYNDGSEELYDMQNDPYQLSNLADSPQHADQKQRLREELESRLKNVTAL